MKHLRQGLLRSLCDVKGPIRRDAFFHLLWCTLCRKNATQILQETKGGRPEEENPDYAAMFGRLNARVAEMQEAADADRKSAAPLLESLLALPREQWTGTITGSPRYARWALGNLFLARSAELIPTDPPGAGELANAALAVAGACREKGAPAAQVHDLFSRAWLAHAAVTRVLGLPDDAATGRELAAGHLPPGLGDPAHAAYCVEAAESFEALGLWNEALALWERAVRVLMAAEQPVECAKAAVRAGLLWANGGGPEEAARHFTLALRQLEDINRPDLWAAAYLGLALSEALSGREEEAAWALSLGQAHINRIRPVGTRVPLLWHEGRVLAALGRFETAYRTLRTVASILAEERPVDALIAALEAACAVAEDSRMRRAATDVHEVIVRAADLPLLDEAKRALAWLAEQAENGRLTPQVIAHVARSLRQLQKNTFLVFREIDL